ncbi:MAG: hypothetical protein ABFD84_04810 [Candidatus Polarisedimenticolia bacterium]
MNDDAAGAASPVEIETLDAAALAADDGLWRLYDAAFPADEREPRAVVVRSLELGVGLALRARRGERTGGLALAHLLRDPAAVFLVYLAVDPASRGWGIGRALFEETWRRGAERLRAGKRTPLGLVWEVDEREDASGAARGSLAARTAFFARQGGAAQPGPYVQPPIAGPAPIPMRLFFRAAPGTRGPFDRAFARRLARAIHLEKYGAVNGVGRATLDALRDESSD